ncbi:D-Tyr tRNAtyr deacylase-like domain-containing protein [Elsinoe ampelina]|uniref:D-aminoacyl-tRNA deacylase n=1 Tax=Elsinoe ampelina TaxID=302913 RepID=A0A6A6GES2_9PEZI|nr:D-Tyr tRNAtyr deacylase-like domain-containing protein [Elsinoe ampelina]
MANKVLKVKLWDDDEGGKWKKNVQEIEGEILCVSQFTLLAGTKKNKPDLHKSAPPGPAKELYDRFFQTVQKQYREDRVKDGVFQAMMDVALINDGPVGVDYSCEDGVVTIEIDTSPPPMKNPTGLELPEDATIKGKIEKQFILPASLLE